MASARRISDSYRLAGCSSVTILSLYSAGPKVERTPPAVASGSSRLPDWPFFVMFFAPAVRVPADDPRRVMMEGWQEVAKIIGMLVLIFVIGGWLMPKMGVHLS